MLLVLFLVFWNAPTFYANESVIFQLMMYIVLAQGINLLYGFTGYLPFGYVGFFGIGAYGAGIGIQLWGWPGWAAVLLGGGAAVLLGVVLIPLLRLTGAYFAIGSLAAAEVVYYVVSNPALIRWTKGPYGLALTSNYHPTTSYVAMLGIVLLSTAIVMFVRRSSWGLALRALKEDPVSARGTGINVVGLRAMTWLVSAILAGLAGGAYAWHVSVFYPSTVFDLNISVFAIVFTLFGGGGTVIGPIIGVVILYGIYNVIGVSNPQYFQLIYGVLIMVFVLFLPNGVMALWQRRTAHER